MIPELLLEEINLGEKKAQDYYEKYGETELNNALAALRKSDDEIRSAYPYTKIKKEITKKTLSVTGTKTENKKASKSAVKYFPMKIISVAAAVLLFSVAAIPLIAKSKNFTSTSEIRTKGAISKTASLKLYRMTKNSINAIKNGAKAREGDLIQVAYNAGENNFGFIFSVDGNGNITKHFPETGWTACELTRGLSEVPLEYSYELDDAPKFEYFIFVTSNEIFDMNFINEMGEELRDLNYLRQGAFLPEGCEESIFVLNK